MFFQNKTTLGIKKAGLLVTSGTEFQFSERLPLARRISSKKGTPAGFQPLGVTDSITTCQHVAPCVLLANATNDGNASLDTAAGVRRSWQRGNKKAACSEIASVAANVDNKRWWKPEVLTSSVLSFKGRSCRGVL